ncbi:MAG: DUF3179 domain-containing protein [Candidatus Latescibacterota bacterium]|nr:MAG: DUF3179 domain-containing protein [Candidatus Latescibacterota bacterium]
MTKISHGKEELMLRIVVTCTVLVLAIPLAGMAVDEHAGSSNAPAARVQDKESPPPGVEMLLPRGQIPAIFAPEFVSAEEAEIPDDAWVLGVFLNGEAHAYSLNLLNAHEIVNDNYNGLPAAAVW